MLTGEPPFYGFFFEKRIIYTIIKKKFHSDDDIPKMYKNIEKGNLKFPSCVSNDARELLKVNLIKKINF